MHWSAEFLIALVVALWPIRTFKRKPKRLAMSKMQDHLIPDNVVPFRRPEPKEKPVPERQFSAVYNMGKEVYSCGWDHIQRCYKAQGYGITIYNPDFKMAEDLWMAAYNAMHETDGGPEWHV